MKQPDCLLNAFRKTAKPPCEVGPCKFYMRCATKGHACAAWGRYLATERRAVVRHLGEIPSRQIFVEAEGDRDPDQVRAAAIRLGQKCAARRRAA